VSECNSAKAYIIAFHDKQDKANAGKRKEAYTILAGNLKGQNLVDFKKQQW
jgi:hypothetical protein